MLLTTQGTSDILNLGKNALQKWQKSYVEVYKSRKYETEKRLAESMIRRHCSIIFKNKVEMPTLNLGRQSSNAEVDDIMKRMKIDEDAESKQIWWDEAVWASEVLKLRDHEITDEAEDRTIIKLKMTNTPIKSIVEI